MMSFSLPQFLLLCALIDFSPMLDDGYDAQLSVGMSTIYRQVVSGLWDCLSMGVWVWGAAACGHVVWVCSEKVLASIIMTYFSLILNYKIEYYNSLSCRCELAWMTFVCFDTWYCCAT